METVLAGKPHRYNNIRKWQKQTILILAAILMPLLLNAQETPSSVNETIYTTNTDGRDVLLAENAVCPGDVFVGDIPHDIKGRAETTSDRELDFEVIYEYTHKTLSTTTKSNRGDFVSEDDTTSGITTLTLNETFKEGEPLTYEIKSTATAPGPAKTRFRTILNGSTSRDETCEFNVLPETHQVTVLSFPSDGVEIDVEVDGQPAGSDVTGFSREIPEGSNVALTAPDSFEGQPFTEWRNGSTSTNQRIEFTVNNDVTVTAFYGDPPEADVGIELAGVDNGVFFGKSVNTSAILQNGEIQIPPEVSATLRFLVENSGPDPAVISLLGTFDISLLDIIDAVIDGVSCGVTEGSVNCMAELDPGEKKELEVNVETGSAKGNSIAGLSVIVEPPTTDPNPDNNSVDLDIEVEDIPARDLALEMNMIRDISFDEIESGDEIASGAVFLVSMTVSNVGTEEMPGGVMIGEFTGNQIYIEGYLPNSDNCDFNPIEAIIDCNFRALQPGKKQSFVIAIWSRSFNEEPVDLTVAAEIDSPEDDNPGNDSVTKTVTVIEGKALQAINATDKEIKVTTQSNDPDDVTEIDLPAGSATQFTDITMAETVKADDPSTGNELASLSVDALTKGISYAILNEPQPDAFEWKIFPDEMSDSDEPYISVNNQTDVEPFQVSWLGPDLDPRGSVFIVPKDGLWQGIIPDDAEFLQLGGEHPDEQQVYRDTDVFTSHFWNIGPTPIFKENKAPNVFDVVVFDVFGNSFIPEVATGLPVSEIPETLRLHPNFPNPFNPTTTLRFDLPEAADVHVEVHDLLGRKLLTMPGQQFTSGTGHEYSVDIDAAGLSSGIYLYRVIAEADSRIMEATGRMVLVK